MSQDLPIPKIFTYDILNYRIQLERIELQAASPKYLSVKDKVYLKTKIELLI